MKNFSFKKPSIGSKINWSHPLSHGLLSAWLLNEGNGTKITDSATGKHGTIDVGQFLNLASWTKTSHGSAIQITNESQYVILGPLDYIFRTKENEILKEFTIVHCFENKQTSSDDSWVFGPRIIASHATSSICASIPNSDGDIVWQVGGFDSVNQLKASGLTVGFDLWVFTNSPSKGMEIWQNGKLVASDINKNPAWVSANTNFVLGDTFIESGGGGNGAKLGNHFFFYVYNRALSNEEIINLNENPFDFYKHQYILHIPSGDESVVSYNNIIVGGKSSLSDYLESSGGISGNGAAKIGFFYKNLDATGGISAGGESVVNVAKIENTSGGVVTSGQNLAYITIDTHGGVIVGGSADDSIFDLVENIGDGEIVISGEASVFTIFGTVGDNGVHSAGNSLVGIDLVGSGGAVTSGEAIKHPGPTSAKGEGGISSGGSAFVNSYTTMYISPFGVKSSGRAINIRRGPVNNIRVGLAYVMKNDNKLKDALREKSLKPKIRKPTAVPVVLNQYVRFTEKSTWCSIEECKDGVLPNITIRKQGIYLPSKG